MQLWCKCLHAITQCIVVLELSSKDTCPHPNTPPIWSLLEVNFWIFHPMDLTLFLIRLTTFTFHYCFFFFFHFMHFSQFLSFTHPWCKWNVMRLITLIHKYHQYHINFPISPNIIEITIIPQFHNFPTIPIISIIKYNYFLHTKITKNNQINF